MQSFTGAADPAAFKLGVLRLVDEVVRRTVDPAYVAYADANGLWDRAPGWRRNRDALALAWLPYLDGETDRDEVPRALVEALK